MDTYGAEDCYTSRLWAESSEMKTFKLCLCTINMNGFAAIIILYPFGYIYFVHEILVKDQFPEGYFGI